MTDDDKDHLTELRDAWQRGGSAKPLMEELIRLKCRDQAGALARLALRSEHCQDRDAIEKLLEQAGSPPPGWPDALIEFSQEPTIEKWDSLMSFTPVDVLYQRIRNSIRFLRILGTNPNVLFLCATRHGTVPDAFDLLQSGEVDPETVVQRAQEAPPETRAMWLGLAAEAAFARGDDLSVVRLLRLAYGEASGCIGPEMSVAAILENATPELKDMIDALFRR